MIITFWTVRSFDCTKQFKRGEACVLRTSLFVSRERGGGACEYLRVFLSWNCNFRFKNARGHSCTRVADFLRVIKILEAYLSVLQRHADHTVILTTHHSVCLYVEGIYNAVCFSVIPMAHVVMLIGYTCFSIDLSSIPALEIFFSHLPNIYLFYFKFQKYIYMEKRCSVYRKQTYCFQERLYCEKELIAFLTLNGANIPFWRTQNFIHKFNIIKKKIIFSFSNFSLHFKNQ